MMRLLYAEWLKTAHSALRWLVILVPVVIGAAIGWYIVGRPWIAPRGAFSGFFSAWAALVMPLGIAVIAGVLAAEEEENSFTAMRLCVRPPTMFYLAKLVLLVLMLALATALAVGTFYLVLQLGGYDSGAYSACYGGAALTAWAAALPLVVLHLWLAMAKGLGASVGVGICGALVGALIGDTMLGDGIWQFVPWAWPLRLSLLTAVDPAQRLALAQPANIACAIALISGILLTVGSLWWFSRWEGRQSAE